MQLFTDKFLNFNVDEIINEVNQNGFFCFEDAFRPEFIERISFSVERHRFGVNVNWTHGVRKGYQYYFTHMLSISKEFFDYVCHPKVFQICSSILGKDFRLKAMRYYETQGRHHMQWHTDNKTDKDIADIPGIIFIAYLNDVYDGEFQYISGSHRWSGLRAYSDFSDEEIENKYKDKVISFKKPQGTILIYNSYGVHRAKPVKGPNYLRKSLFFQVDSELNNAEPILFNPSLCPELTTDVKNYLGFGLPSTYEIFPKTKLSDYPFDFKLTREMLFWPIYRFFRYLFDLSPLMIKNRIKLLRKKNGI